MTNGLDFERQVHALLKKMGFEAEVTKASGDGGIDIIAHSKDQIISGKYVIQCKDWSKPVGEPPVRDLYGVVMAEHANKGILITTATFTAPALKFAEGKPMELIDGTKFHQMLTKYNIAGSHDGAMTVENERIEELTVQLNNNPKNIFALKELADIYLMQENYNKAVGFYEILVAMKPSIETERLKNAYEYGVLNYGVALAKLKRYDNALKIYKENGGVCCFNEAYLTHYLGLYDIATSIYSKLKSVGIDRDEFLEKAYLQMQLDCPGLAVFINKDGVEEVSTSVPLDTAIQKAAQEGRKELYRPVVMECLDITREFDRTWRDLKTRAESNQIFSDSDNTQNFAQNIVSLENRCFAVISKGKDVLTIATANTLQEFYKEEFSRQIILVEMVSDSISKYIEFIKNLRDLNENNWEEFRKEFRTIINSAYAALNSKISEYEELGDAFIAEEKEVTAKWEETINNEKTEWRERLYKTLYSDCKNQKPSGQSGWLGRFFGR